MSNLILIRFSRPYGPLFPGEVGAYPPEKANELLQQKYGVQVDESGSPLEPDVEYKKQPNDETPFVFDEHRDPFLADGLSKQASHALHDAGLHTVLAVREFIESGGHVADIPGVTETQAEKIGKLYGVAE